MIEAAHVLNKSDHKVMVFKSFPPGGISLPNFSLPVLAQEQKPGTCVTCSAFGCPTSSLLGVYFSSCFQDIESGNHHPEIPAVIVAKAHRRENVKFLNFEDWCYRCYCCLPMFPCKHLSEVAFLVLGVL